MTNSNVAPHKFLSVTIISGAIWCIYFLNNIVPMAKDNAELSIRISHILKVKPLLKLFVAMIPIPKNIVIVPAI